MLREYVFPRDIVKSSSIDDSLEMVDVYDLNK